MALSISVLIIKHLKKAIVLEIHVIDELLNELHRLELKSGYHHIQMRQEDIPKTAFMSGTVSFLLCQLA